MLDADDSGHVTQGVRTHPFHMVLPGVSTDQNSRNFHWRATAASRYAACLRGLNSGGDFGKRFPDGAWNLAPFVVSIYDFPID